MAQLKAEIKKLETLMEQSRAVVMVRNGWDTKKRACAAEGRAKAGEAGSRGEFETMNAHVIALETSVRNKTEVKEVCVPNLTSNGAGCCRGNCAWSARAGR